MSMIDYIEGFKVRYGDFKYCEVMVEFMMYNGWRLFNSVRYFSDCEAKVMDIFYFWLCEDII